MSAFVPGLIVGYALGIASMCGLVGLYLLHRPPYVAPTKRRKYRDAPERQPETATTAEVGGIQYEHLGMTGCEQ